jgi:hypothetical protein
MTQAIRNQIASARAEGLTFTDEQIETIRKIVEGEVSKEEVIKEMCDANKRREADKQRTV